MTVAPTNTFVFTNSASNDVVVFTDTSNQMIRMGTMSNAPSVMNVGSNYMRLQGNVAVGNINPSYPLDVVGDINFTGNLRQAGALYVGSQWSNSGTNVFILSSNIGIGKSNPAYPLDIVGDLNFSGNLRQGGALYVGSQWSNSGNRVFIMSSNIGIGTTTPATPLDVVGDASFRGNIQINNAVGIKGLTIYKRDGTMVNITTSSVAGLSNDGAGIILSVASNNNTTNLRFWGSGTEIMRLTGDGNLGIGKSNPAYKLDVNGSINTSSLLLNTVDVFAAMIGIVLPYAGSTEPNGWLLCFGQAISRTTYALLFAIIGTTYGTGDGSTTFNVPDLRGRTPFGKDNMGGTAANRITSAVSGITGTTLGASGGDQRLHAHTHAVTDPGHTHGVGIWNIGFATGGTYDAMVRAQGSQYTNVASASSTTGISIQNNTQGGTAQNIPPAVILNYIIKY